jgi:hypothetical protein
MRWNVSPDALNVPAERVFVMEPLVEGTAAPGNTNRNIPVVVAEVRERIRAIVREHSVSVDGVTTPHRKIGPLADYAAAVRGARLTNEELDAAAAAADAGATHLLVPTILEWTAMRTDDPIGTFILPHNAVALDLRLMQLRPPALVGEVVFRNRARLTLNQSPMRLLDNHFRRALLHLVSGRM